MGKFTPPQRGSVPPLSDGFTPPIKQRTARISSPIGQNDPIPRMELSCFGQNLSKKKTKLVPEFHFFWAEKVCIQEHASSCSCSAWLLRPHARVPSRHARTHLPPLSHPSLPAPAFSLLASPLCQLKIVHSDTTYLGLGLRL